MTSYQRRFFDPRLCRERRRPTIVACVLFWSVLATIGIRQFIVFSADIVGESMAPSLADGERTFVNRWIMCFRPPERGDVVAFQSPDFDDMSVKRVIAMPGETVCIRDDRVFINGRQLLEPYLPRQIQTSPGLLSTHSYVVDKDCYFVLGDNRDASADSRYFGAVRREWIVGRIAMPNPSGASPLLARGSSRNPPALHGLIRMPRDD
jgi:signal peptidase I